MKGSGFPVSPLSTKFRQSAAPPLPTCSLPGPGPEGPRSSRQRPLLPLHQCRDVLPAGLSWDTASVLPDAVAAVSFPVLPSLPGSSGTPASFLSAAFPFGMLAGSSAQGPS